MQSSANVKEKTFHCLVLVKLECCKSALTTNNAVIIIVYSLGEKFKTTFTTMETGSKRNNFLHKRKGIKLDEKK